MMSATHIIERDSYPLYRAEQAMSVLLIDDQPVLARAIENMLQTGSEIAFHYCGDARDAIAWAIETKPTTILLDLKMPHLDGMTLLQQLRQEKSTCHIPIIVLSAKEDSIVKAKAFELGASDYLIKLPDSVELIARISRHSHEYADRLEVAQSQARLNAEVARAADHIHSLLPMPLTQGSVRIDWRFEPSTQLGGDAFGYRWLDESNLAIYIFDVTGHGVGASLLAVSILNTLNHSILPAVDFCNPSAVLRRLNEVFEMHRHGQRFFTIWYGVYSTKSRTLYFSAGGHPPPLLFTDCDGLKAKPDVLPQCGPPIGLSENSLFQNLTIEIPQHGQLLLYTDGVVESHGFDVLTTDHQAFTQLVTRIGPSDQMLDRILNHVRCAKRNDRLDDDCSLILIDFQPANQGEI